MAPYNYCSTSKKTKQKNFQLSQTRTSWASAGFSRTGLVVKEVSFSERLCVTGTRDQNMKMPVDFILILKEKKMKLYCQCAESADTLCVGLSSLGALNGHERGEKDKRLHIQGEFELQERPLK